MGSGAASPKQHLKKLVSSLRSLTSTLDAIVRPRARSVGAVRGWHFSSCKRETGLRMLYVSRWKSIAVVLACLASLLFTLPNFFSKATVERWPAWLPRMQLPLGLDLSGGAHLLLAMDTNEVRKDWLDNVRDDARRRLREAKIAFTGLGVVNNAVQVRLAKPEDADAAAKVLQGLVQQSGNALLGTTVTDLEVKKSDGGLITVTPTEAGLQQRVANAISASIETVRRRVDQLGTAEASVVRQGRDRVLVQFPGIQDTTQLKALIGKTAKLSFHEVHSSISADEAKTRVPAGFRIYSSMDKEDAGPHLLRETPVVRGDELVDAQPAFDQQTNEPIISFRFNNSGARKFGNFTKDNVNRPFAIVLDEQVISAPVIREPILGGSGQISGSFTVESANQLAIQLRSGALPAKLTIVEERTVGPSLGADSVEAGKWAIIVGFIGVMVYMTLGYGLFGLFAIVALVVNLAFIIAALSLLQATLTLPGIAGIVLTMGMSVDANVLINERIRDELRAGRTPVLALDTGFTRAYGTIFDTNMTGLLAAVILIWFGSGPVRGFGVTLAIGIIASAFTATTVTRYLVAAWLRWTSPKVIPI
jgi:protein-export membrane protein SecD